MVEPDAKPTIEALEAERKRLRELERNLAAERDRIQAAAARDIASMHEVLRDATERAQRREQELEKERKKLERKLEGGRLRRGKAAPVDLPDAGDLERRERELAEREARLVAAAAAAQAEADRLRELEASLGVVDREVAESEALAQRAAELSSREDELDRKLTELVDAERRSFELLAARRAELAAQAAELDRMRGEIGTAEDPKLDERQAGLDEREAALDRREAELAARPEPQWVRDEAPDLRAERERLEAKAATLAEGEGRLIEDRSKLDSRERVIAAQEKGARRAAGCRRCRHGGRRGAGGSAPGDVAARRRQSWRSVLRCSMLGSPGSSSVSACSASARRPSPDGKHNLPNRRYP